MDQSKKYEKIEKETSRKSCHQSVLASTTSGKGRGRLTAMGVSEGEKDQGDDVEGEVFDQFAPVKKSQRKRKR